MKKEHKKKYLEFISYKSFRRTIEIKQLKFISYSNNIKLGIDKYKDELLEEGKKWAEENNKSIINTRFLEYEMKKALLIRIILRITYIDKKNTLLENKNKESKEKKIPYDYLKESEELAKNNDIKKLLEDNDILYSIKTFEKIIKIYNYEDNLIENTTKQSLSEKSKEWA